MENERNSTSGLIKATWAATEAAIGLAGTVGAPILGGKYFALPLLKAAYESQDTSSFLVTAAGSAVIGAFSIATGITALSDSYRNFRELYQGNTKITPPVIDLN